MSFWSNLSQRERLILTLVIPGSIAVIGYLYYWQPLQDNFERLKVETPQRAAELAWVKHELENSAHLLQVVQNGSDTPILTVIEKMAIQSGVKAAIQRVQPKDENNVQLWFNEVLADDWFRFVKLLGVTGVEVDSATLTRRKEGAISVRGYVFPIVRIETNRIRSNSCARAPLKKLCKGYQGLIRVLWRMKNPKTASGHCCCVFLKIEI